MFMFSFMLKFMLLFVFMFLFMRVFAVPRCFKMIRYDAYMLVDLLPPFLKTYGYAVGRLDRGRRLSDGTSAARLEIGQLETLTRGLNALQVVLVLVLPCC